MPAANCRYQWGRVCSRAATPRWHAHLSGSDVLISGARCGAAPLGQPRGSAHPRRQFVTFPVIPAGNYYLKATAPVGEIKDTDTRLCFMPRISALSRQRPRLFY
ncbi:hypothetical protein NDU88_006332 [Pleurodeles waltl]|uniref:DUF4469 domain-containing protein n=1 Tax=Pleurodeles waltl TaxID=8319 RepID=A0AAV7UKN9_PLEWA|nr:hypothetical protein NDU88_006332 [Pleurodeles waltl]